MMTWRRGTNLLAQKTRRTEIPLDTLIRSFEKKPPHAVPGTAVFLTSAPDFAPTALLHNLKHNKVLHEHNVILTIVISDTPRIPLRDRVTITPISSSFSTVALRFGYMEQPNVPKALAIARKHGWQFDIMSTSFFLSRRALKPAAHSGMPHWQDRMFIWLAQVGERCHRLLPDPHRPGGGGRHAGHDLSERWPSGLLDGCRSWPLMAEDNPATRERRRSISRRDGMSDVSKVRDLTPEEVARGIREGKMLLVDVREPNETTVESYPDAVLVPLSSFDPAAIPDPAGKEVVFACRSGKRSVTASLAAQERGYRYDAHLAGGIIAWKAAGLPTKT